MRRINNVRKLIIVLLLVMAGSYITAGVLFFSSGESRDSKPLTAVRGQYEINIDETKTLDIAALESLKIKSSSTDITLITTEEDTIRAHLYGGVSCSNKNNYPVLKLQSGGNSAEIIVEWPNVLTVGYMMTNIKLDVYLPKSYQKDLSLETSSGDIQFGELALRNFSCTSSSGDLKGVLAVTENTSFKSSSGRYEAGVRASNAFTMESSSGDFRSGSVEARLFTRNAASGLTNIKSLTCTEFSYQSNSGDLKLDAIRSVKSTLETTSGKITIYGENTGEARIKTSSGDISWQGMNADFAQVKTTAGSINITGLAGGLDLQSSSGDATVQFKRLEGTAKLTTTAGRVKVNLPKGSEFGVDCRTTAGDIKVNGFEVTLTGKVSEDELIGTVGSNKNMVQIETSSGDITLSSY